ncbi:MAG: hypothetical protein HC796_05885 [Synechococcaceae cyanobacterium RL_1_2]|nr:hypothetical protein [Synechococcaceae cyanobacterium RL_1_2]
MKKYSINWEDGELVSIEVDGMEYDNPEEIPDPEDRAQIERLMASRGTEDNPLANPHFHQGFEDGIQQLEGDTTHFPTMIVGIFLTIGLIMLAIASVSTFRVTQLLARKKVRQDEC